MGTRALVKRVLLGWLAAEWIGILIAYSFAVLVLSFFIAWLLLGLWLAGAWLVVPLVVFATIALLFAWWAAEIPRDLLRRAWRPMRIAAVPPPSLAQPAWQPARAAAWRWEVTPFLGRMTAVEEAGGFSARAAAVQVSLDRLLPAVASLRSESEPTLAPIPALKRIAVTSQMPVTIIDLAGAPNRDRVLPLSRSTAVTGTRDNPGRIRQV